MFAYALWCDAGVWTEPVESAISVLEIAVMPLYILAAPTAVFSSSLDAPYRLLHSRQTKEQHGPLRMNMPLQLPPFEWSTCAEGGDGFLHCAIDRQTTARKRVLPTPLNVPHPDIFSPAHSAASPNRTRWPNHYHKTIENEYRTFGGITQLCCQRHSTELVPAA